MADEQISRGWQIALPIIGGVLSAATPGLARGVAAAGSIADLIQARRERQAEQDRLDQAERQSLEWINARQGELDQRSLPSEMERVELADGMDPFVASGSPHQTRMGPGEAEAARMRLDSIGDLIRSRATPAQIANAQLGYADSLPTAAPPLPVAAAIDWARGQGMDYSATMPTAGGGSVSMTMPKPVGAMDDRELEATIQGYLDRGYSGQWIEGHLQLREGTLPKGQSPAFRLQKAQEDRLGSGQTGLSPREIISATKELTEVTEKISALQNKLHQASRLGLQHRNPEEWDSLRAQAAALRYNKSVLEQMLGITGEQALQGLHRMGGTQPEGQIYNWVGPGQVVPAK